LLRWAIFKKEKDNNMSTRDALQNQAFLSAADPDYLSDLYSRYLDNPEKVDQSWADFFKNLDDDSRSLLDDIKGASWTPTAAKVNAVMSSAANSGMADAPDQKAPVKDGKSEQEFRQSTIDAVRARMLIHAYRVRGHIKADLDPLGLMQHRSHPELDPETYGFSGEDWDREIFLNGVMGFEKASLRELMMALQDTYCGTIGVEFMHISDPAKRDWVRDRIEDSRNHTEFTSEGKKAILSRLTAAEGFEKFLQTKYTGTKRFGLEGGESLVPAIEQIMKRGGQLGLKEIVLGMAHRGRLNVLTNVMGKSFTAIFHEFQGGSFKPEDVQGSGDVKYHLGTSSDRDFDGNTVHLSLTPNPSHLEIVNPVVVGKTYAKQFQRQDTEKSEAMALVLHGDAAVAGQGVVQETLLLANLDGYGTGGTIHYVINNQIGFTTPPHESRSGTYATDIGKSTDAPIFHVNGDDPEAVVHVARMAIEYRQEFKNDVFIDMICYRRHGHNEGDEPAFTQPNMYKRIKKQKTTRNLYAEELMREGVITNQDDDNLLDQWNSFLEKEFKAAESYKPNDADMLKGHWEGIKLPPNDARRGNTAISDGLAKKIGETLTTVPKGFNLNSKIKRQLEAKKEMFESGTGFDWATAEALALGALVHEGYPVRLSGQDSERGTFSQRHSVWIDQKDRSKFIPLNHIDGQKAKYHVYNSPLSEEAVLGFEYGFSWAEPNALVMWEAQFGDFVNGAQVVIDQFISSGETKWLRMSGLTMLLPHGYEGQGPEHSSARMERFLQSCAEDNIQVANCTTPANYFHILRRQMHRDFRKPLIIFTPKSLLRHKRAVSNLDMMTGKQTFHRVLYEDKMPGEAWDIKRVVLCTGKVFYDLEAARDEAGIKDVTMLRLEQLYPFPDDILKEILQSFPNAEVVWCQEEPENMGAWTFVDRRLEAVLQDLDLKNKRPRYIGRPAAASPAVGLLSKHKEEQDKLVQEAITI
tara:strand:- start:944 stop:3871 length:2928 start_codon:yes stop_codon:yes gene_type:complete